MRAVVDVLLPNRCLACGERAPRAFCVVCAEQLEPVERGFAYVGPLADVIRRAKYGPDAASARGVARWFADVVDVADVAGVTFVPAHWTRRLLRGFDLPALLASAVAQQKKLPLVDGLQVTRRDPRLAKASDREQRAVIVKGRFAARTAELAPWQGKRVALVDDVKTTGATLAEAAAVLEAAGVVVVPVTLACTPRFSDGAPSPATTGPPPG